jgi:hypothetical protein
MRVYDQACLMDGHNTKSPGQTVSWYSTTKRYRPMEPHKRTREIPRQKGSTLSLPPRYALTSDNRVYINKTGDFYRFIRRQHVAPTWGM